MAGQVSETDTGLKRIVRITEQLLADLRETNKQNAQAVAALADTETNCLLVEDDERDAYLSKHAIESIPHVHLEWAATGDQAIRLLQASRTGGCPFQILFLDLNLRGSCAQGYDVLSFVRREFPHIHTIIVSGCIDAATMNLIATDRRSGGYLGIINKPLSEIDLREILAKHGRSPDYEL